jgi:hypothetical protein
MPHELSKRKIPPGPGGISSTQKIRDLRQSREVAEEEFRLLFPSVSGPVQTTSTPQHELFKQLEEFQRVAVERQRAEPINPFDFIIGPGLRKAIQGKGFGTGAAIDVALLPLLFGKGPVVAARTAAQAGIRGAKVPALRGKQLVGTRFVKLEESKTQFPSSPSIVTAYGQRILDRASEQLTKPVSRLRESESGVVRGVGSLLTPTTSRARVPKQSAKLLRQEAARRKAARAQEIHTIRRTGRRGIFDRSDGVQTANFWYAQIPRQHRNTGSLKLIRNQLKQEQARLRQGDIPPGLDPLDAVNVISDLGEEVAKLTQVIKSGISANEETIQAVRTLMDERKDILIRAGKLDPDEAIQREGLVSRWLGLETSGEEVFLGHRLGSVRTAPSNLVRGIGLGRARPPQGVGQQNRLVLARRGQLRTDLNVAVEDWQAAQAYELHNIAKGQLALMGERIVGKPKRGYVLINPKGHTIPRYWRVSREQKAIQEGFDPEGIIVNDLDEYVRNYAAIVKDSPRDVERILEHAAQNGYLDDLRQVPVDVFRRYQSRIVDQKLISSNSVLSSTASAAGKVGDVINDMVYISLIYSNPGYIPANLAGNLIFAGLDQGVFLPINLIRSGQLLTKGPRRVRDLVLQEVGFGPTVAIGSTRPTQRVGRFIGRIPDDGPRTSAFLHQLAKQGVISKTKPWLSNREFRKIEKFMLDPKSRPLLNDARDAAVQAMVDFERLSPLERSVARRLLFVWPWIRGATRYPFRFAADHPIRSGALAYAVYEGKEEILDKLSELGEVPSWLEFAIKAGKVTVGGKEFPRVLPTRSFSPISTTFETIGTFIGRPGAETFAGLLNPAIEQGINVAGRETSFGTEADSYRESLRQASERLVPNVGLARDLVSPPSETGLYPEDVTRSGRLRRAIRLSPIAIDPEEAKRLQRLETGERRTLQEKIDDQVSILEEQAEKWDLSVIPSLRDNVRHRETYLHALKELEREHEDFDDLPEREKQKLRARAEFEALRSLPEFGDSFLWEKMLQALETMTSKEISNLRRSVKEDLGVTGRDADLSRWNRGVGKLKQREEESELR